MDEKKSMIYLLSKYNEVYNTVKSNAVKAGYNADNIVVDLESFIDFFKGIKFTECDVKGIKSDYLPFQSNESLVSQPILDSDVCIVSFDNTMCCISSKEKKITLDLRMLYDRDNKKDKCVFGMQMYESTSDGVYRCVISDFFPNDCFIQFWDNESLKYTSDLYGITLDELKSQFVSGKKIGLVNMNLLKFTKKIAKEDIAKMANIIYKNGLQVVYQMTEKKIPLEMTEGFRKYFELSEEEKSIIQNIQDLNEKNDVNIDDVLDQLINLKNLGVELSSEQELLIKKNSEKFNEYKKNRDIRLERQRDVRQQIIAENEKKAEWLNSSDNPTNKRIEEFNHLKKQIQCLTLLYDTDSSLLNDSQLEFLKNGRAFLEMIELAMHDSHDVDTGMSPEIRKWYQENYSVKNFSEKSR